VLEGIITQRHIDSFDVKRLGDDYACVNEYARKHDGELQRGTQVDYCAHKLWDLLGYQLPCWQSLSHSIHRVPWAAADVVHLWGMDQTSQDPKSMHMSLLSPDFELGAGMVDFKASWMTQTMLDLTPEQRVDILRVAQRLLQSPKVARERVDALVNVLQALSQDLPKWSSSPEKDTNAITVLAKQLAPCDRCPLFMLDEAKKQLWAKDGFGQTIRTPQSAGIAGSCVSGGAGEGTVINIPDAYEDSRFDRSVDMKTGYRTFSILAVPFRNEDNRAIGVLQCINKFGSDGKSEGASFTEEDVEILETFSNFVAAKLGNCPVP
jgi:hypothetical protein